MVRKVLSQYFERTNRKYEQRGIEWVVHDNHYWLAIKIHKEKADTWKREVGYDSKLNDFEDDLDKNDGPHDHRSPFIGGALGGGLVEGKEGNLGTEMETNMYTHHKDEEGINMLGKHNDFESSQKQLKKKNE